MSSPQTAPALAGKGQKVLIVNFSQLVEVAGKLSQWEPGM